MNIYLKCLKRYFCCKCLTFSFSSTFLLANSHGHKTINFIVCIERFKSLTANISSQCKICMIFLLVEIKTTNPVNLKDAKTNNSS